MKYCLARANDVFLIVDTETMMYSFVNYKNIKAILQDILFIDIKHNKFRPFYKTDTFVHDYAAPSTWFFSNIRLKRIQKVYITATKTAELHAVPIDVFLKGCEASPDLTALLLVYGIDIIYDYPIRIWLYIIGCKRNVWYNLLKKENDNV